MSCRVRIWSRAARPVASWTREVVRRVRGLDPAVEVPLDVRATAFQWQVWRALRRIPGGATRAYGEVARAVGRPAAVRAVARACASNPAAVVVPCHRVVRTDGGLDGYSFGLVRKEALLGLERSTAPYIGCTSTKTFCRKGCAHERRIREGNRIQFATLSEAIRSGYRPCGVCSAA